MNEKLGVRWKNERWKFGLNNEKIHAAGVHMPPIGCVYEA